SALAEAIAHSRRLGRLVGFDAATRKAVAHALLAVPEGQIGRATIDLARLVPALDDDLVWKAYEQAVRRARAGSRIWMLEALGDGGVSPAQQQQRRILTLLAVFLGDAEIHSENPGLGRDRAYVTLSVQNFAA